MSLYLIFYMSPFQVRFQRKDAFTFKRLVIYGKVVLVVGDMVKENVVGHY